MRLSKAIWRRCLPLIAAAVFLGGCQAPAETGTQFHRFWPDNLYGVDFVDGNTGFIAGYSGTLLRTTDGGKSWEARYIGRNELIRNVDFIDAQYGWAVGHRGSIFHSRDGGKSWEVQKEVPNTFLRDISFADRNHGWVVGHDATILHTADGGANWETQKLDGFQGRDLPRLHGVYAKDSNTAMLVGEFGVVAHTEDGGALWSLVKSDFLGTLLAVTASGDRYLAVGLDGQIRSLFPAPPEERPAKGGASKKAKAGPPASSGGIPGTPAPVSYEIQAVESGAREHFFAISATADGSAVAVGRSVVVKIVGDTVTPLLPADSVALPFVWFGGVSLLPDGRFWLAGIRGLVANGELDKDSFGLAFNLAATDRVKLVSSRWTGDKK